MAGLNENEREQWARALRSKGAACSSGMARGRMGSQGGKGIAPNKAAGSKGGIRRQGSKRG